jgi:hypothetical protein
MNITVIFLIAAMSIVPIGAAGELIAALFSKRVRSYITAHPGLHILLWLLATLLVLCLIPARSSPHHRF